MCMSLLSETLANVCRLIQVLIYFSDNRAITLCFFRTNLELYKIPILFGVVHRPCPIVLDKVYQIHANVQTLYGSDTLFYIN